MTENLLEAPERDAIEALLLKVNPGTEKPPTFERILGFISGAAITPGGFEASDWMQPLFDVNRVVFTDLDDIEHFIASLVSLYERVEALRARNESICPFDLENLEVIKAPSPILDWATGLHSAVNLQEDIWYPYEDEAEWIPEKLKNEVNLNIQCLQTLVDPKSIPEVVKDPIPFQKNFLHECPGWEEEPLRDTWDEELMELFKAFCLGRLYAIIESLQHYSAAYDEGDIAIVDMREVLARGDGEAPSKS